MKWSFSIGRISGIDVRVHASFALILVLAAFQWGAPHGPRGALFGVLLMICLFACVVLHELAHSLVAQAFGCTVRDILLLPIGGVSRMEKAPEKPYQELLVALVGPLTNLALAAGLFFVAGRTVGTIGLEQAMKMPPTAPSATTALIWLLGANIFLALFNLIPAFPLDGGRVFRALLSVTVGSRRATQIAAGTGQLIAIGLGLLGVFSGNLILALVAFFIFMGAGQEQAEDAARTVLHSLAVGDAYNKYALTLAPGDQVSRVIDYLLTSYEPDFAVVQGNRLLGVITRADVLTALATQIEDVYVATIMKRDVMKVDAARPLDEVRVEMMQKDERVAAVYRDETYLGLVSLEDIAEALLVVGFRNRQDERRKAALAG
jgi:Zn-dependent protease/CBS domain-containing protein